MSFTTARRRLLGRKRARTTPGRARLMRGTRAVRSSARNSVIARSPATRGSRAFGVEVKTMDFPMVSAGADTVTRIISTTATIDVLNLVQVGAGFWNRVGARMHMKSVHVTGDIFANNNAGNGASEFNRVMLVYDRQPNGAVPGGGINDILADYGNDGTVVTSSYSKANPNNVERFAIIRDSRIAIVNNATGNITQAGNLTIGLNSTDQNKINWFVPLKDLETHFKSSTNPGSIADVATGALYLVTFGSSAVGAAGTTIQFNSRLRYIDL